MPIGDQHPVRIARKQRNWRLADLAIAIGRPKSVPMLSMIENGYNAKRGTRLAIAAALDRPVEELFPEAD